METKVEKIKVPTSLYPRCESIEFNGKTIGDRLLWAESVNKAFLLCINDVNILVNYLKENTQ